MIKMNLEVIPVHLHNNELRKDIAWELHTHTHTLSSALLSDNVMIQYKNLFKVLYTA